MRHTATIRRLSQRRIRRTAGRSARIIAFAGALIVGLALLASAADEVAAELESMPANVSFAEHIRPLFAQHCMSCHGGVKQASGLSFVYRGAALSECESGMTPIVPGNLAESYLIERVSDADPDFRMPPAEHGRALNQREIALLARWIEQGAAWEEHWAFVAPRPQTPPKVTRTDWPRQLLDHFILARLEAEGLSPAPEASKAEWLRRSSLDLTGLPPSAEEYRQFERDARKDAYQRDVDRLLASPSFGERWASMWLDLARYADTQGFETDNHRGAWPYRDWVIRAFNADMPYDEFTVKQLAGDLLPNGALDDRLATAFHRNTQTNNEGGTDDEEFRIAAVLDRVATTWQVWQGLTFRCTQCHSHPYDPFRHEEYYRFAAFFNTSRDEDLGDDHPLIAVPDDPEKWDEAQLLDNRIAEIRRELFAQCAALTEDLTQWRSLEASSAQATGQTQLRIRKAVEGNPPEVLAEGTISANGTFTLEFPLPGDIKQLTALRIDALPKDEVAAIKMPEAGFVLSRLKAYLVDDDDAEPREIEFEFAHCDDADPVFDPADSLRDNREGWCQYTRMFYPRHAVFVARRPVELPPGGRLRLSMQFDHYGSGGTALVIQRGRYAISASPAWTALVQDERCQKLRHELAEVREARQGISGTATPVMAEQPPPFARRTFMFVRGNWLDKDVAVQPGTPAIMPPMPAGSADRLAMARWLASRDNSLTARVMVNRLWQELFGVGLVETADDFGSSGTAPSHPELLDHLALRFQNEYDWSVKRMLRELVISATYRQSGATTTEKIASDRQNLLLSRGPRTRLTAEMLRDQALALSGRLSPKMYGPPVMPPQPDGVWRSVYSDAKWVTSEGEDRYRRAIYTYCKRTSGYPAMLTFDMPSREVCVARRFSTNTPLQALVTLNDEAFIELAQGFAERMQAAGGTPQEQIASGYFLTAGRNIPVAKLSRLAQLYAEAQAAFDLAPTKAGHLASDREVYALTVVANAMLSFDEILTK